MGKMVVTQFDPRESRQTMTYRDQAVEVGGKKSWNTRLESSGEPTCEGCGKDLDPKTAVYLGPIGLPGADGKLYCGYGCVDVPAGPASLRDRLDGALDRALALPMPPGGVPACRGKLVEAVMETIGPMIDIVVGVSRCNVVTFSDFRRVVRELGLEPAEQE